VPGPLGDLGRRDTGIQPKRNGRVAQVVRALGQRRGALGISESCSTCRSPDSIGGAYTQGLCEGRGQRNSGATDSGDEQAAVGARRKVSMCWRRISTSSGDAGTGRVSRTPRCFSWRSSFAWPESVQAPPASGVDPSRTSSPQPDSGSTQSLTRRCRASAGRSAA